MYTSSMSKRDVYETGYSYRTQSTFVIVKPYTGDNTLFCSAWSTTPADMAYRITWDNSTGKAYWSPQFNRTPVDPSRVDRREVVKAACAAHTLLAQRETNHPSRFGLVRKRITANQFRQPETVFARIYPQETEGPLGDNFWGEVLTDGTPASMTWGNVGLKPALDTGVGPRTETEPGFAWFHPDAHSDRFGTPFVYATTERAADPLADDIVETTRWCLGVIGFKNATPAVADWNDDHGVAAVCAQVTAEPSENLLVTLALLGHTDPNHEKRDTQDAAYFRALAAEQFNPETERVDLRAVWSAGSAWLRMPRAWREELAEHDYVWDVTGRYLQVGELETSAEEECAAVSAMVWSLYDRESTLRPQGGMALQGSLQRPLPSAFFDEYGDHLATIVTRDNLGYVVRADHDSQGLFCVTWNPALVAKFPAAFNLPADARLQVYRPGAKKWVPLQGWVEQPGEWLPINEWLASVTEKEPRWWQRLTRGSHKTRRRRRAS